MMFLQLLVCLFVICASYCFWSLYRKKKKKLYKDVYRHDKDKSKSLFDQVGMVHENKILWDVVIAIIVAALSRDVLVSERLWFEMVSLR